MIPQNPLVKPDISREAMLRKARECEEGPIAQRGLVDHINQIIKAWDNLGGYETNRDRLVDLMFARQFDLHFIASPDLIDNIVTRYHLLGYLKQEGHLKRENLEGNVRDIGSYKGTTLDALALHGADVLGIDIGGYSFSSFGNKRILKRGGITYLQSRTTTRYKRDDVGELDLITCFNVDWVENMDSESGRSNDGFAMNLYEAALPNLAVGGQVLYTFSIPEKERKKDFRRILEEVPNGQIIKLPSQLNDMEDYALIVEKAA